MNSVNNYSGGFYSPMSTKYVNTSISHYCLEENTGISCLVFSLVFAGFRKDFLQEISISTGRNDRLKAGKLLLRNLI